jgi:hypothetical protein
MKMTGKLTVEKGDKKLPYDRPLLKERARDAMRNSVVGSDRTTNIYMVVKKALDEKDLTRREIVTLYEALYVNIAESLAGTESAYKEAREEAERAKSNYHMEREWGEKLNTNLARTENQLQGLLKVIARAERDQPHE